MAGLVRPWASILLFGNRRRISGRRSAGFGGRLVSIEPRSHLVGVAQPAYRAKSRRTVRRRLFVSARPNLSRARRNRRRADLSRRRYQGSLGPHVAGGAKGRSRTRSGGFRAL